MPFSGKQILIFNGILHCWKKCVPSVGLEDTQNLVSLQKIEIWGDENGNEDRIRYGKMTSPIRFAFFLFSFSYCVF